MWVVFEGLDKAGKGTLEWELLKATNFKHIVIDRGPVGYITFDVLFNRIEDIDVDTREFLINIKDMIVSKNFLVVYCKVPVVTALQRITEHNETCPYNYEHAQMLYDRNIRALYEDNGINVVTIDTTKSIEECVKQIVEKLQEVNKNEL